MPPIGIGVLLMAPPAPLQRVAPRQAPPSLCGNLLWQVPPILARWVAERDASKPWRSVEDLGVVPLGWLVVWSPALT